MESKDRTKTLRRPRDTGASASRKCGCIASFFPQFEKRSDIVVGIVLEFARMIGLTGRLAMDGDDLRESYISFNMLIILDFQA